MQTLVCISNAPTPYCAIDFNTSIAVKVNECRRWCTRPKPPYVPHRLDGLPPVLQGAQAQFISERYPPVVELETEVKNPYHKSVRMSVSTGR